MRLQELAELAGLCNFRVGGDADVSRPIADSRKVRPGDLFFAMPSARTDSHAFLEGAAKAGATAAVLHSAAGIGAAEAAGLAWALPKDFADAAWRLSHALLGFPSRSMRVIGVTGTNGKTTTAWLLRQALESLGQGAAYVGTLGYAGPDGLATLENTTPFAPELALLLARAREAGCQAVAMEASSHALAERRVDGVEFDAAVFTNLTQDHLDFHETMEAYEAAKRRLFVDLPGHSSKRFVAALNLDDPAGRRLAGDLPGMAGVAGVIGFSLKAGDLVGHASNLTLGSFELELDYQGRSVGPVRVGLGGAFNVENALATVSGLLALGVGLDEAAKALESVRPAPGRFEAIANDRGVDALVDYAHTPDALEKLLESVRALCRGRVITVFGCGGDRDRTKRPKMARAASQRSDVVVLTSDNPRTEDPCAILREVAAGLDPGVEAHQIVDRPEAIRFAVGLAHRGDAVVVAGKGHEDYQIIGREKFPMDDRALLRAALGGSG
jgi:UDP-N-acetylmuramoyl-L-alanyl-D-glutamate--2,6-diaminopimelate ligase